MQEILFILAKTVSVVVSLVTSAMFLRAILSFISGPDGRLYAILCLVTEPFIAPVRVIMFRLNIGQNLPIDLSFFITYLILTSLEMMLPAI